MPTLLLFFDGLGVTGFPQDGKGKQEEAVEIGQKAQVYYRWARTIVDRYEGTLLHILADDKGTGLHILFGAPDKHADDTTRGLRCALSLQQDPGRPSFITGQRLGVASVIVFAAPIGSSWRREYTVIGDEINLSARLTSACPPEEVLVDAYTRDRTARQFEFETLTPLPLKGKSQPVMAYRLLGERPEEIRQTLQDLRAAGCRILTLGQYLQPSPEHLPVEAYVPLDDFENWRRGALEMGFSEVASAPFVRSSYHAKESFNALKR